MSYENEIKVSILRSAGYYSTEQLTIDQLQLLTKLTKTIADCPNIAGIYTDLMIKGAGLELRGGEYVDLYRQVDDMKVELRWYERLA